MSATLGTLGTHGKRLELPRVSAGGITLGRKPILIGFHHAFIPADVNDPNMDTWKSANEQRKKRREARERVAVAIAELTRLEEILLAMLASEPNPRRTP